MVACVCDVFADLVERGVAVDFVTDCVFHFVSLGWGRGLVLLAMFLVEMEVVMSSVYLVWVF